MSYSFQFLVLLALVFFASIKVTFQSRVCKIYIRNTQDSIIFNAEIFAVISIIMAMIFTISVPDMTLILFALFAAVVNLMFQSMYAVALSSGPVSITVLIINFSVIVSTVASVIMYKEKIYLTQIFGICFLIVSMLLSVTKGENEQKMSTKWLILSVLASLFSASGAMIQKTYGRLETDVVASDTTFLFFMYGFASLFGFFFAFIRQSFGKRERNTFGFSKKVMLYAGIVGIALSIYQKINMFALTNIDGTFLFPTYSGVSSLVMTLIGVVIFKDRLNKKQCYGVVCGIICVILMNIRTGISF